MGNFNLPDIAEIKSITLQKYIAMLTYFYNI